MKKLLIVESPAKIKTITKFLGSQFRIMSTVGHIKDLPKRDVGVKMDGEIEIEYVVLEKKDKVISDLKKAAKESSEIFLAPDPDREGEIIAWHVAQELKKVAKNSPIHRITFNEITKPAIEEALQHPTDIDENKVAAQQARRVLDRWVGYEVSPILWKKFTRGLSAGRVQSVALKFICVREEEIRSFKPEEYWSIHIFFTCADGLIKTELVQIKKKKAELPSKTVVDAVLDQVKAQDFAITAIKDTQRTKNPYAPFMTSTLQQAAYNRLGFSVQRTMGIAQKLYEGVELGEAGTPVALITYMRTDSLRIAQTAIKQVREYIKEKLGNDYLPEKTPLYSKEKAQDAHEAIRPVDVSVTPEKIKPFVESEVFKLYELIWRRFVACQMSPARYAQRQVTVEGGPFQCRATGSTLLFDGFLKVYAPEEDDEKDENTSIPLEIKEGMATPIQKVDPKQHFTQPPPRYTEASLVKELEKAGIGRPSTYATILKTIQLRSYTTLDTKKRFVPTELGAAVTRLLEESFPHIMDVSFTAHLEEDLDKVAQGDLQRDKLLREFYDDFSQSVKAFTKVVKGRPEELTTIICPTCGKKPLAIRFGKAGSFLGCTGFPECTFSSNFERKEDGTIVLIEKPAAELLDIKCPKCGKPLQRRIGRYGPFISCSGYPECKYIHLEKSSFKCPGCGKGHLVKRSWKGKIFWGCETYPACKFTIAGDIDEHPCPKCKNPYLIKKIEKDGTQKLVCPEASCGYTKEIVDQSEQK